MSGVLAPLTSGLNTANNVVRGIGTLASAASKLSSDLGLGGFYANTNTAMGPWAANLQPASWRGLRMAARVTELHVGRRVAVHEYPYNNQVWVEDLGLGTRTLSFTAFIFGDDVYTQRAAFLTANELAGPGELIHPSLGSQICVLTDFSCAERYDLGRVVEMNFSFIRSSTASQVAPAPLASATPSTDGIGTSFASSVAAGIGQAQAVVATVSGYVAKATQVVGDASLVMHAVTGLVGNFGRYNSGSRTALQAATATVDSALASVTTARTLVGTTGAVATNLAAAL